MRPFALLLLATAAAALALTVGPLRPAVSLAGSAGCSKGSVKAVIAGRRRA